MIRRGILRLAAAAALACALPGCAAIRSAIADFIAPQPPHTTLGELQVMAEPAANRNSATALDIVFVYRPKAVELLPKSAPEWFARKAELQNALGVDLDVVALQVPPAMPAATVTLPARYGDAVEVLAYPGYFAKDAQIAVSLMKRKRALITLKPDSIEYTEQR